MEKSMIEKLRDFLATDEGRKASEEFWAKIQREDERKIKAKEYLVSISKPKLDKLISRLIEDNGDEWRDKCWKNRYEPYPTNLMGLLFDGAIAGGKESREALKSKGYFSESVVKFRGYYFSRVYGQGVIFSIFNSKKEEIFSI